MTANIVLAVVAIIDYKGRLHEKKPFSGCKIIMNPLLNFLAVVVERLLPLSSKKIWVPFLVLGPALAMRL